MGDIPETPGLPVHPTDEALFDALTNEDDLGAVVRAHICIEAVLEEIIELAVKRPSELTHLNLRFEQRVWLAVVLGALDAVDAQALRVLGNLRNAFAHRIGTELSAERVNQLYEALSETVRDALLSNYQGAADFQTAAPKTRFATMAICVHALLVLRLDELRKMRGA